MFYSVTVTVYFLFHVSDRFHFYSLFQTAKSKAIIDKTGFQVTRRFLKDYRKAMARVPIPGLIEVSMVNRSTFYSRVFHRSADKCTYCIFKSRARMDKQSQG